MVDCGLHIGTAEADWINKNNFTFNPQDIRFVLLTHSHLDHCGLIPKLYKDGFKGKVYCTRATGELAKVVMSDCAKNSNFYDYSHVNSVDFHYIDTRDNSGWGKLFCLTNDLRVSFLRGSHILGSSSICINWGFEDDPESKGKTILFSGDVGCNFDDNEYLPLLKSNHFPFPDTNFIVIESTYGGRNRESKYKSDKKRLMALEEIIIDKVINNGGKIFIPAFSIHRTQEIIFDLYRTMLSLMGKGILPNYLNDREGYSSKKFAICVDSPMAVKANRVYIEEFFRTKRNGKHIYRSGIVTDIYAKALLEIFETANYTFESESDGALGFISVIDRAGHASKKGKRSKPSSYGETSDIGKRACIVVASAGMCEAGPIVSYLDEFGQDVENTVVMTGFQAAGSRGRAILESADEAIKGEVINLSSYYSAHADEDGLIKFLFYLSGSDLGKKTTIFINHGTDSSKSDLKKAIEDRASKEKENDRKIAKVITLDGSHEWFDLNTGEEFHVEEFDIQKEITLLHEKIDILLNLVSK
ncbi:MBL fold metallo-hydrolase [Ferrimonas pelagia]|uniref:MBL fold metallo-hydrolase n=1 Tax=Ferrimonas pelagia TaxID=1177826 RepID=A0ABP9EIE1_9GAMM